MVVFQQVPRKGCNLAEKSLSCPAKFKDQHHESQEENQSDFKIKAEETKR